ncbi:hypothetical protein GCM10017581_097910 [Dactylosporangium matsuzakiense]|uniref:Secreted protein n=2 Tax=Dactylosporangium matsuzakiense TaxID=53360 RepID=A0A9W6KWU7_9ACTN|nr:hypothetical protein GCM10017581_097910 [Dactylosporangium matsuzakiense]
MLTKRKRRAIAAAAIVGGALALAPATAASAASYGTCDPDSYTVSEPWGWQSWHYLYTDNRQQVGAAQFQVTRHYDFEVYFISSNPLSGAPIISDSHTPATCTTIEHG